MQKLFRVIGLGVCLQFSVYTQPPVVHALGSNSQFTAIHDAIVSSTACPDKNVKDKGKIEYEHTLTQSSVEELQHILSSGGKASIQFSTQAMINTAGKAKAEYKADIWVTVYSASGKKRKLEKIREKDKTQHPLSPTPYEITLSSADVAQLQAGDTLVVEGKAETKAKVHRCGKEDQASAPSSLKIRVAPAVSLSKIRVLETWRPQN